MTCKHCQKDFKPRQQFCSTKCRVYSHQKRTGPIRQNIKTPVTIETHRETPKPKFISEFKKRIPLSKKMEKKLLNPEPKTFIRKRGEMNVEDYV